MTTIIDELIPTAADCKKRIALAEAEKASDFMKKKAIADAEKQALLDRLQQPSGVSDDERLKRAAAMINRAVSNGMTEVRVGQFTNKLVTDGGRAINQQEPGWEKTLTGLPREVFQFWKTYLQPRGYRIKFEIVDWPGGLPGDIGITLAWG